MTALEITSLKNFMNQLLAGSVFDIFLLEEASIATAFTVSIDGHINKSFYPESERDSESLPYDLKPWSEVKELCFSLIKGRYTPINFKFVLQLKPEHMEGLIRKELTDASLSGLKALMIIIKFDGTKAVITTGASFHTFVPDKEPEKLWDKTFSKYLSDKGISYETL